MDKRFCVYKIIDENKKTIDLRLTEANPAFEKQSGLNKFTSKLAVYLTPGTDTYQQRIYDTVVQTGEHITLERWYMDGKRAGIKEHDYSIQKEDLAKTADHFFRVITNKMPFYPGTGVGLHVAARITGRRNRTNSARSRFGHGFTFSFTLPIRKDEL
ncbi:hypothetical protein [Chitinophaga sp.]|uniref:ATP-binding protein n=1 Tax=Chitinophaga sp. TaxID=1869181 RepID=UPI0031D9CA6E